MSYEWGEKYEALREQCITTEKVMYALGTGLNIEVYVPYPYI